MAFLLDTMVVSEAARANPDPRVRAWLEARPMLDLHISVLLLGEVRKASPSFRRAGNATAWNRG